MHAVIAADKYALDAHTSIFIWSHQLEESLAEILINIWATSIAPGLTIDAAEEFVLEIFADRIGRYALFSEMAIFEARRGRFKRAEELFFACLDDISDMERQEWGAGDIKNKYAQSALAYDENPIHLDMPSRFYDAFSFHLAGRSGLHVVDAACGTGLLAPLLKPHAAWLVGLELSPAMAQRASPFYDQIDVGDMTESLLRLESKVDVVACCGATCYLRDLSPFLKGCATALKPGGLLVFSDYMALPGHDVMITSGGTRRFCRSAEYLLNLAANTGFSETGYRFCLCFGLPGRVWTFSRQGMASQ